MGGMGGPVAVNQMAIHAAMDTYGIEFRQECFEKVVKMYRHFIKKASDEAESKRAK